VPPAVAPVRLTLTACLRSSVMWTHITQLVTLTACLRGLSRVHVVCRSLCNTLGACALKHTLHPVTFTPTHSRCSKMHVSMPIVACTNALDDPEVKWDLHQSCQICCQGQRLLRLRSKHMHFQTRENSTAQVVTQHSSPLTTRTNKHTSARRPTNEAFSEVNSRNAHTVAQGRSSSGTVF